jgi:methionine-rich copper-binding protein CopC
VRKFLCTALLVASPLAAWAHAHLKSSTPAADSTVSAPSKVTLNFTEGVVTKLSTFKLVPAVDGVEVRSHLKEWLSHKDNSVHVETGGTSTTVVLGVKPLKSGTYAVIWKVLSDDGHTKEDSMMFRVK